MSSSICAENEFHNTHHLLFPKKSMIRNIDNIPPRKLLTRRGGASADIHNVADMYSNSPPFSSAEETLLRKFLPYNNLKDNSDDDDDSDPYSSDHFRMFEFKVRRCTRSRSHDWTDCPFAHPGEKARRRDPRRYHYSGTICSEYRRGGGCSRGDSCEFAHGVFECWLHPARYRTEACKDGKNCKRKVCFFAHTPRQLRILPVNCPDPSSPDKISSKKKKFLSPSLGSKNCYLYCHCSAAALASPSSTLFGMSHLSPPLSPSSSVSPPLSPIEHRSSANGVSPISRYTDRYGGSETCNQGMVVSYKDVLTELMSSLEGLNFSEASSPVFSVTPTNKPPNLPWLDVSCFNCDDQFIPSPSPSFNCEDQQQFILSPSSLISQTPTTTTTSASAGSLSNRKFSSEKIFSNEGRTVDDNNGSSFATPDLGWVNDLLM